MSSFERYRGIVLPQDSSIYSLHFGTRTKLLEDELNELQWRQIENLAAVNKAQKSSGALNEFDVVSTTVDNIFYLKSPKILSVMADGYLMNLGLNTVTGQPTAASDDKLFVKLNPAGTANRSDLVFIEAWFESVSYLDTLRKYGGDTTPTFPNEMFDARANVETARRIQLKWRIRVSDGETNPLNIKARLYNGTQSAINYLKVDDSVYCANVGIQRDADLNVRSLEKVYCIPLVVVNRKANTNKIVVGDVTKLVKQSNTTVVDLEVLGGISTDGAANIGTDLIVGNNAEIANDLTVRGNTTIVGDLTINGNTTFLDTDELKIKDNIITLNSGVTGAPLLNAGLDVDRGTSAKVSIIWDEALDKWRLTTDGTNFYDILSSGSQLTWDKVTGVPQSSTTAAGIVQLSSSTNNASNATAATSAAVKAAYDLANTKVKNSGVPELIAGAALPAAGTVGRVFINTGDKKIYRDNGISWDMVGGSETIDWANITGITVNQPEGLVKLDHNGHIDPSFIFSGYFQGTFDEFAMFASLELDRKLNIGGGTVTGTLRTHRMVLPVGTNAYATN